MVTDEEIQKIITTTTDIRDACKRLIQRANERGGEDNITAVLIQIEEAGEGEVLPAPERASTRKHRAVTAAAPPPAEEPTSSSGMADQPTMPGVPNAAAPPPVVRVAEANGKEGPAAAPEKSGGEPPDPAKK
jgi:hypothetical protein